MSESATPRTDEALRSTMAETGRLGPEHAALTYLARQLERELAIAVKALNVLASWGEGSPVRSSFDEPHSARQARDALAAMSPPAEPPRK